MARAPALALVVAAAVACGAGGGTAGSGAATGPLNASYFIEGREARLAAGRAEIPAAPGSAAMVLTTVFGRPITADLDGDGDDDAALLLVQQAGGSGTFYYVAAAVNDKGTFRGTNAVLLGDRIAPQDLTIEGGRILSNYAERRPDEPLAAAPSVGRTKRLALEGGRLVEVAPSR